MDPYKALGIDKKASEQEVKRAYRKLAHKYHPDKGDGGDDKKFKEVTEAYEIIGDKQKRAQYDQFGNMGGGAGGPGGGFGGFDFGGFQNVNVDFGGGGFGDIFDTFFGGGGNGRSKQGGPSKGSDIEMVIQLRFEEAIFGTTKEIEISRYVTCTHCKGNGAEPGSKLVNCDDCKGTGQKVQIRRTPLGQIQTAAVCSDCNGTGRIPEKKCSKCHAEGRVLENAKINVKVPAGIHDQAVIRLRDKGEAGMQGGTYGDLFVHVSIVPSNEFERINNDIHNKQSIHMLQAVMGDEVKIATVHGDVTLKIPHGTQSGKVFKISGKGVPRVGSDTFGDHYVKIIVDIPEKLSKKEKELYNNLIEETQLDIKPQNKGLFG